MGDSIEYGGHHIDDISQRMLLVLYENGRMELGDIADQLAVDDNQKLNYRINNHLGPSALVSSRKTGSKPTSPISVALSDDGQEFVGKHRSELSRPASLDEAGDEIQELRKDLAEIQRSLRGDMENLEERLGKIQGDRSWVENLKKQLEDAVGEIESIEGKIDRMNQLVEKGEEAVERARQEANRATSEADRAASEANDCERWANDVGTSELDIEEHREDIEEYKKQIESTRDDVKSIRKEIGGLIGDWENQYTISDIVEFNKQRLDEQTGQYENPNKRIEDLEGRIEYLETELEKEKQKGILSKIWPF